MIDRGTYAGPRTIRRIGNRFSDGKHVNETFEIDDVRRRAAITDAVVGASITARVYFVQRLADVRF